MLKVSVRNIRKTSLAFICEIPGISHAHFTIALTLSHAIESLADGLQYSTMRFDSFSLGNPCRRELLVSRFYKFPFYEVSEVRTDSIGGETS
jgi:hypothetical protein